MRTARRVPDGPVDLDEVIRRFPTVRQSALAKHDDCALSSYFETQFTNGWTTHPAASGTIFHRVAAECIRTMRENDSDHIPPGEALAILEELLEQRDVAPEDRVRVPLRDLPTLRFTVIKFAKDNTFSIRHVVDVENRLEAPLTYADDDGVLRERVLSGQIDVLIADPTQPDGSRAIAVDWKSGWYVPGGAGDDPEWPERNGSSGVSYHAFFQLRFYAWLIMKNYPSINQVVLREFYPKKTEARKTSLHRGQLDRVEKELGDIVRDYDRCLASGKPKLKMPGVEPWNPSPGKHCKWCALATRCPIPPDVRSQIAVASESEARSRVAQLEVVEALREKLREALRPWVEEYGAVASRWAKGRRALMLRFPKSGKGRPALVLKTVEGTDRAVERKPEDKKLEDAMKRSVQRAREERDAA